MHGTTPENAMYYALLKIWSTHSQLLWLSTCQAIRAANNNFPSRGPSLKNFNYSLQLITEYLLELCWLSGLIESTVWLSSSRWRKDRPDNKYNSFCWDTDKCEHFIADSSSAKSRWKPFNKRTKSTSSALGYCGTGKVNWLEFKHLHHIW